MRRPATAGSVMPRKSSGTRSASPAARTADERRDRLHQRLAGAARFRHRDEARRGERQAREQRGVGPGVEIVHEMQARAGAQRADAGDAAAGELRHRLAAEARSAGAEKDDVAVAPATSRFAAASMPARSSVFSGSRSSGSLPSAWRARMKAKRLGGPRQARRRTPAPSRRDGRCVPRGRHRSIATAPSTLRASRQRAVNRPWPA